MKNGFTRLKHRYASALYDSIFSTLMPAGKEPEANFFFIKGCGRNGSTLLASMLNNHPGICIPPEHTIIPHTIHYWHLHPMALWSDKVKYVCSLLSAPSQWEVDIDILKHQLFNVPVEKSNAAYLLKVVYDYMAQQHGKRNVLHGDKTPGNTMHLKMIKKEFSNSKIIFLIRDPRDVMASFLAADQPYYSRRFDFMLWRWKNGILKYESLARRFPTDVMLLKYEDLVTHPQTKLDEITDMLGLQRIAGLHNNPAKNMHILGVAHAPHHQNIHQPVNRNSIGKWKEAMNREMSSRIERKLGVMMKAYGYGEVEN